MKLFTRRRPSRRTAIAAAAGATALAVTAGLAVAIAAPATAAGSVFALKLAPQTAATTANIAQIYTGTAVDDGNFGVAGATVTITVSEKACGLLKSNPLHITGTGVSGEKKAGCGILGLGGTFTDTATVTTGAGGSFGFNVASSTAGTVDVEVAAAGGATASGTLTVTGGATGNSSVTALSVSPKTSTQYVGSAGPSYTVKAVDAAGNPVAKAEIDYQISGPDATPANTHESGGLTGAAGTVTVSIPNGGTAGTDVVTFYVNNASTGTSNPDPGEPFVAATAVFETVPASTSLVLTTPADANPTPDQLPAGTATRVAFVATLLNGTSPVAGAVLDFTLTSSASPTPLVESVTTNAQGIAAVGVPVTAAQAKAGVSLSAVASLGASGKAGYRESNTKTVTFAEPAPYLGFVTSAVQAAAGGTVTVQAEVTDQFGTPYPGEKLSYTIAGRNSAHGAGTVTTDAKGIATISYTDTGTIGDKDIITVTDTSTAAVNSNPKSVLTATVTFLSSVTPAKVVVAANSPAQTSRAVSLTATQPVTATVENSDGVALTGQPVTVKVGRGFVGASGVTAATGKDTYAATTNASGQVTVYVGSVSAGAQTIVFTAGKASGSAATVTYTPLGAYNIGVAPTSVRITPGDTQKFGIIVTDEYNNPVGSGVSVSVSQSGAGSLTAGVSPQVVSTGANGTVTVTVSTGSATSGSGTLTAKLVTTPSQASDTTAKPVTSATAKYTIGKPAPVRVGSLTPIVHTGTRAGGKQRVDIVVRGTDGKKMLHHPVAIAVVGANVVHRKVLKSNRHGVVVYQYRTHKAGIDTIVMASKPVRTKATATIGQGNERPRIYASSPAPGALRILVKTVPKLTDSYIYVYRAIRGGKKVWIGAPHTNRHGVGVLTFTGLPHGKKYGLTAIVINGNYHELYAKIVRVKIK